MSKVKLTCISSNATAKNDGFITKLQGTVTKSADTGFGIKVQTNQETYYIKMNSQVPINQVGELDLDLFRIQQEDYTIPSGVDAGKVVQLKWLFLK